MPPLATTLRKNLTTSASDTILPLGVLYHNQGLVAFGRTFSVPELGRFITRDPSGYPDGPNDYLYCHNNPINRIDPLGLEWKWSWKNVKAVGAAFLQGAKVGAKAVVNASADTVVSTATLGIVDDVELINVTNEDRAAGYDKSYTGARVSTEVLAAVGTAGLTETKVAGTTAKLSKNAGKYSKKALAFIRKASTHGDDIVDAEKFIAKNANKVVKEGEKATETVVKKVKNAGNAPHGNSKTSMKPQHRYEIVDIKTGEVQKTGISGQKLNKNGTSPRANRQVNKLNQELGYEKYKAVIKETNIPGRSEALKAEKAATNKLYKEGHKLRLQVRPKPDVD